MRPFIFAVLLCLFLVDVVISLDKERDCKCRINSKKRIIGGRLADPMSFPWQVSLQWKSKHLRSITHPTETQKIGEHFVQSKTPDQFQMAYGSNDLVMIFDRKQYAEIRSIHTYPHYKRTALRLLHDIAIIELLEPLSFSEAVQPACLPARYREHYDGALQFSGFGVVDPIIEDLKTGTRRGARKTRYMKQGQTYDLSDELLCKKQFEICTENRVDSGKNRICNGDSGGPLHYTKGGRSTVIGVTSYSWNSRNEYELLLCSGQEGFTRVSAYMTWIKKTIGDDDGDNLCFGDDFSDFWK